MKPNRKVLFVLAALVLLFTMCSCVLVQCGNSVMGDVNQTQSVDLGLWGDPFCWIPLVAVLLCCAIAAAAGAGGQ